MRLLRFTISAHRGQPARELELDQGGASVVAISGPEGCGKTTLLEAIALHKEHLAAYNSPPVARAFLGTQSQGRLEIVSHWRLTEAEAKATGSEERELIGRSIFEDGVGQTQADPALVHILARYHHDPSIAKVDLFPETRLGRRRGSPAGDPVVWQRMYRLGLGAEKYGGLPMLAMDASADQIAEIARLIDALCPRLTLGGNGLTFETPFGPRDLAELSLSQRLAYEMAATFVLVGLEQSVVLIDGLERGFASGSAPRNVDALQQVAPRAQLIVTSNDPGLVAMPSVRRIQLPNP